MTDQPERDIPRRSGRFRSTSYSPPERRILKIVGVYAGLVIVPSLIAFYFLGSQHRKESNVLPGLPAAATVTSAAVFSQLVLAVVIIVAACAGVGALLRRIGQPSVIGEILTGVLLGPSVFGALWPQGFHQVLPADIMPQLGTLANLGVILFVFLAGLEVNTSLLRGRSGAAVVVSNVSIALPFLLGIGLAFLAYDRFAPAGVGIEPFALFMGVSMSVTALPVMARILMDKGMFRSEVGTVALTCALVDDVTAWSLLAVVVAFATAASFTGVVLTVVFAILFAAVMILAVRPLLRTIASSRLAARRELFLSLVLAGLLFSAFVTDKIGVHPIFGALLFGMICPRDLEVFAWIREHVSALTTTLLLPLFFAFSGLRTQFGLLGFSPVLWLWALLILGVAIIGKFAGSAVAARAVGNDWRKSLQLGALMNCRGLTELVVLNIGLDLGVLSPTLFTMLVIMALVSTAMTAPIVVALERKGSPDAGSSRVPEVAASGVAAEL
jgi:Kef-type K+ transport system membrane component KefB